MEEIKQTNKIVILADDSILPQDLIDSILDDPEYFSEQSDDVRSNFDLVKRLIDKGYQYIFENLGTGLINDPRVYIYAIQHGYTFEEIPEEAAQYRCVSYEAMTHNGEDYDIVSRYYPKDRELALKAVRNDYRAFSGDDGSQIMGEPFVNDPIIVRAACENYSKQNPQTESTTFDNYLSGIGDNLLNRRRFMLRLIALDKAYYSPICDNNSYLADDKKFIMRALSLANIFYSGYLLFDREVMRQIKRTDPEWYGTLLEEDGPLEFYLEIDNEEKAKRFESLLSDDERERYLSFETLGEALCAFVSDNEEYMNEPYTREEITYKVHGPLKRIRLKVKKSA